MTDRGSGSGGPNPQVLVLITGVVALLGIPVGLILAGSEPGTRAAIPTPAASLRTALVPAAAPAPPAADPPVVTVRELPHRPVTTPLVTPQQKPAAPPPALAPAAPVRQATSAPIPRATKPHARSHRAPTAAVVARRRPEKRHLATAGASPVVVARRPAPEARRTYASAVADEPRPVRAEPRIREYAGREAAAPREKPSRERPRRERSRHREASRPKEPEAFGAGNSGFHYGASYDPYSMHVGR